MTQQSITPETAPRTFEELKNIGRFQLRQLAEQLGMFVPEENKKAFMQLDADGQARALIEVLEKQSNKKANGAAAGVRQPSNKSAGKGSQAAGKVTSESPASTAGGQASAGASEKVLALIQANTDAIKELSDQVGALRESLDNLAGNAAGTNHLITLGLSLTATIGEEFLKAPKTEVLKAAIEDKADLEPILQELWGENGSGDGGGEEEEAGE